MFSRARFLWAFVDLVNDPGLPSGCDPYAIPISELCSRAFAFEKGQFRELPSRQRALAIALAMIRTDLIPRDGKESLYFTCREYAERNDELEAVAEHLDQTRSYLVDLGLLDTENLTERVVETANRLGRLMVEEWLAKR